MLMVWFADNGGTGNSARDLWYSMMIAQGVAPGTITDMWMTLLGNLGYSEGTLTDRENDFWCNGGGVIGPIVGVANGRVTSVGDQRQTSAGDDRVYV